MEIINIEDINVRIRVEDAHIDNIAKQKSITKFWERQQGMNASLYNGDAFLSSDGLYEKSESELIFNVYQTEYMNYFYNQKMENGSRRIFSTTLVVTKDDYIVLGETVDNTEQPILQFIGGAYDVVDILDGEIQTQKGMERELFEQLPIHYVDVNFIKPMILVREESGETCIIYVTYLNVTKDQLEKTYPMMSIQEFSRLYFLPIEQKQLIDFAFSEGNYASYVKPAIEYFYKTLITKE
ncbi:MAG: hypothetical protein ACRCV7_02160 [Culicoidibacterales bacterium]